MQRNERIYFYNFNSLRRTNVLQSKIPQVSLKKRIFVRTYSQKACSKKFHEKTLFTMYFR